MRLDYYLLLVIIYLLVNSKNIYSQDLLNKLEYELLVKIDTNDRIDYGMSELLDSNFKKVHVISYRILPNYDSVAPTLSLLFKNIADLNIERFDHIVQRYFALMNKDFYHDMKCLGEIQSKLRVHNIISSIMDFRIALLIKDFSIEKKYILLKGGHCTRFCNMKNEKIVLAPYKLEKDSTFSNYT
ncbi:MAG: hypothetical protein U0V49_06690 [Saprospiraceae bacterium]